MTIFLLYAASLLGAVAFMSSQEFDDSELRAKQSSLAWHLKISLIQITPVVNTIFVALKTSRHISRLFSR